MGSRTAMELASTVRDELSLYVALKNHLIGNHFPPLPISLIQPCTDAIDACNTGDYDKQIGLPPDFTYRDSHYAPANEVVEFCHLEWFLAEQEF